MSWPILQPIMIGSFRLVCLQRTSDTAAALPDTTDTIDTTHSRGSFSWSPILTSPILLNRFLWRQRLGGDHTGSRFGVHLHKDWTKPAAMAIPEGGYFKDTIAWLWPFSRGCLLQDPVSLSERDAVHETLVDGGTIDVGCQATIFVEAIGLGLPAGLIVVDQLPDCLIVHRHDEAAGHGEAIRLGEPRREYPAVRGARLQAFIDEPDLGVIAQVCQDEPGYFVPALNPPECPDSEIPMHIGFGRRGCGGRTERSMRGCRRQSWSSGRAWDRRCGHRHRRGWPLPALWSTGERRV